MFWQQGKDADNVNEGQKLNIEGLKPNIESSELNIELRQKGVSPVFPGKGGKGLLGHIVSP